MDKFLDLIDTLIAYILYGSNDDLIKHKSLRSMRRELGAENQKFICKRGKKVYPKFASKIFELYRLVETLRDLLPLHKEHREYYLDDERIRDFLILRRLPKESRKAHLEFSYDVLYEQYSNFEGGNYNNFWIQMDKDFAEFKSKFKDEKYFGFDEGLNQLERFAELLRFDFVSFFRNFDSSFSQSGSGDAPNFSTVPSAQVQQDILDLYFILGNFEVSSSLRTDTEYLLEYYDRFSDSNVDLLQESLDNLELLMENDLNKKALHTVICHIEFDPYYEPKTMTGGRKFLGNFLRKWEEQYEQNKELLQQYILDEKLKQKIEKVFEEVSIIEPSPYDKEKEELFTGRGFHHFSQLQPLRLLKTYYTRIFTKGFFGSLKKIAQEGYFENREFKEYYSDLLERVEGYMEEVELFESSLGGKGTMTMEDALQIVRKDTIGENEASTIKRFIQDTNARARRVVEENAKILNKLHAAVGRITSDYRTKNPRFVSNLRVIAGEKSDNMMRKIEEGHSLLGDLVSILKNYVVIQEASEEKSSFDKEEVT